LHEKKEFFILAQLNIYYIERVKELEKRISDIEKGELELLRIEYDYSLNLHQQIPQMNDLTKQIYRLSAIRLVSKIADVLDRPFILLNTAIRVLDEHWNEKTDEDHSQNYRNFNKTEKDFFERDFFEDIDENAVANHFMDKMTKFIEAPDDDRESLEDRLKEELLTYREVLIRIADLETSPILNNSPSINGLVQSETTLDIINKNLLPVKEYFDDENYRILINAINCYFENDSFPSFTNTILVKSRLNKKRLGWRINLIFNDKGIKRLPLELLLFANQYISCFKGDFKGEKDYTQSNLYTYFKTNLHR
jgi:hypothetical protein